MLWTRTNACRRGMSVYPPAIGDYRFETAVALSLESVKPLLEHHHVQGEVTQEHDWVSGISGRIWHHEAEPSIDVTFAELEACVPEHQERIRRPGVRFVHHGEGALRF